ncbi:AraC family transcriptional regulator [Marinomonas sp. THO17]|uniref:AraC family transcriptional regulator n=1 Tax=Marinomonas sp. THO17 TaxID=3149048 RepID=UPI00336C1133
MNQDKRLSIEQVRIKQPSLWYLGDSVAEPIVAVKAYIDEHFKESISLDSLAALVGLTRFSLAKKFRQNLGISPYQYVCLVRVSKAQSMIVQGIRPADIAAAVGFFDQSHLAKHFKRIYGMTPKDYRQQYHQG